jgi:hypothetical protein
MPKSFTDEVSEWVAPKLRKPRHGSTVRERNTNLRRGGTAEPSAVGWQNKGAATRPLIILLSGRTQGQAGPELRDRRAELREF